MASNTDIADVNELLLGYYCANGSWSLYSESSAKTQYENKAKKLSEKQLDQQRDRAMRMAKKVLDWTKKNGYTGKVSKVYWTARKGVLQQAVGNKRKVDSGNPTDILLKFSNNKFLGLSAKSTLGEGDIGFKNPGMGTIESLLKIKLAPIKNEIEKEFIETHDLPKAASARKLAIRSSRELQLKANEKRDVVLNQMRDVFLKKLKSLNQKQAQEHIVNAWLDAGEIIYPPYIKVTGTKSNVLIENPLNNPKMKALSEGPIEFSSVGNDSVGVTSNKKRIMKMRFKYESQALASSMKLSGDPWK